jgi:hypothetical protein
MEFNEQKRIGETAMESLEQLQRHLSHLGDEALDAATVATTDTLRGRLGTITMALDDERRAERAPLDVLAAIAKKHMGFETLEPQGSDRLDFKDVGCTNARAALEAAFLSGRGHAEDGLAMALRHLRLYRKLRDEALDDQKRAPRTRARLDEMDAALINAAYQLLEDLKDFE